MYLSLTRTLWSRNCKYPILTVLEPAVEPALLSQLWYPASYEEHSYFRNCPELDLSFLPFWEWSFLYGLNYLSFLTWIMCGHWKNWLAAWRSLDRDPPGVISRTYDESTVFPTDLRELDQVKLHLWFIPPTFSLDFEMPLCYSKTNLFPQNSCVFWAQWIA